MKQHFRCAAKWFWRFSGFLLLLGGIWSYGAVLIMLNWSGAKLILFTACAACLLLGGFFRRAAWAALLVLEGALFLFYVELTPQEHFRNVEWYPEWGRKPLIERHGDGSVTIHNIRDFKYRSTTDYDPVYRTLTFDPEKLESFDVALSHWDEMEAVAHTMLCFNFSDGRHLAVSIEARAPVGVKTTDFVLGLYKQYELLLLMSTPEDLFDLRVKHRGETFYRYRTNASRAQMKKLFELTITRAEQLQLTPEFYNSITRNCTTGLAPLLLAMDEKFTGDVRLLFNGFSDQLLFEMGFLKHRPGESFGSLKARSYVPGKSSGREL